MCMGHRHCRLHRSLRAHNHRPVCSYPRCKDCRRCKRDMTRLCRCLLHSDPPPYRGCYHHTLHRPVRADSPSIRRSCRRCMGCCRRSQGLGQEHIVPPHKRHRQCTNRRRYRVPSNSHGCSPHHHNHLPCKGYRRCSWPPLPPGKFHPNSYRSECSRHRCCKAHSRLLPPLSTPLWPGRNMP